MYNISGRLKPTGFSFISDEIIRYMPYPDESSKSGALISFNHHHIMTATDHIMKRKTAVDEAYFFSGNIFE